MRIGDEHFSYGLGPRFEFLALNLPVFARGAGDNHISGRLKRKLSADEGLRVSRETRGVLRSAGKDPQIILDGTRRNGLHKELCNRQRHFRRDHQRSIPA